MSVIVFNTSENAMYADTVTSLGSGTAYDQQKVALHEFHNGWKVMVGKIGTPAVYEPVQQYLIALLDKYVDEEQFTIADFNGKKFLPVYADLLDYHCELLTKFQQQLRDEGDFSFLVALTDGENTALGVMHSTLGISWGVKPLNGRRDLVLGSPMVTSALNAVDEFNRAEEVPTWVRLENIANIQFIGVKENSFMRYTFDGDEQMVMNG